MDEVQKNDSAVHYSFRLNLATDISEADVAISGADAVLRDGIGRRLLVRMVGHRC